MAHMQPLPRGVLRLERLYRALLWLYPVSHRRAYGPLMTQMFRDLCREAYYTGGIRGVTRLCVHMVFDLARSALVEHLDRKGNHVMNDQPLPAQIGRYTIEALQHTSGMSHIYRATDPASGRTVALKVARTDTPWSTGYHVHRHGTWLARLDHPGIPAVYDTVHTDDITYVVSDFIAGDDLLTRVQAAEGFLPVADVVGWGMQVCDVLTYLHDQQPFPLVQRGLKPRNMMLTPEGRVMLVDFKIIEPYEPGKPMTMIGTEGYAPPEQYKGLCDPRSDIFALGAALHHLLTKVDPREQKPFEFRFDPAHTLNPAVSEELSVVIGKAVSFEANDRYQTAAAFKDALAACV